VSIYPSGNRIEGFQGVDPPCEIPAGKGQWHLRVSGEYGAQNVDGIPAKHHR